MRKEERKRNHLRGPKGGCIGEGRDCPSGVCRVYLAKIHDHEVAQLGGGLGADGRRGEPEEHRRGLAGGS